MPTATISIGAFGSDVRNIHERLRLHGFEIPTAEVDREFFGPGTREAVVDLQRKFGLKATGSVDVPTTIALQVPAVSNGTVHPAPSNGSNGSSAAKKPASASAPSS